MRIRGLRSEAPLQEVLGGLAGNSDEKPARHGVGYFWIESLREHADRVITDVNLARAAERFRANPPSTKEAYLYRSIFEKHFPYYPSAVSSVPTGKSVACCTPTALLWDAEFEERADPSGRAVSGIHEHGY